MVMITLMVRQNGKKHVGSWKDGKAHGHHEVHDLKTGKVRKYVMENGITMEGPDKCLIF
jgi:hypothetical protein